MGHWNWLLSKNNQIWCQEKLSISTGVLTDGNVDIESCYEIGSNFVYVGLKEFEAVYATIASIY